MDLLAVLMYAVVVTSVRVVSCWAVMMVCQMTHPRIITQ